MSVLMIEQNTGTQHSTAQFW